MGYLGNTPGDKFLTLNSQQITGTGSDTYVLDYAVSSSSDIAVFVNNVRQNVNSYTASNTTLTLGGTISASDECWVHFLGKSIGTQSPAVGSVTNDMLAGSIATSKLADGSTFATTNGITEADQWRLTANIDSDINPISANLERVDNTNFGKIGTGMSVSSGLWSFPSTGLWQIDVNGQWQVRGDIVGILITYVSTDSGSSWQNIGNNVGGLSDPSYFMMCVSNTKFFVNVTDISTFRVKFATSSFASTDVRLTGDTNYNETHFTFIRLGDSV